MKCNRCGAVNQSGVRFCNNCGGQFQYTQPRRTVSSEFDFLKKIPLWGWIVIGFFFLVLVASIADSGKKREPQKTQAVSTPAPPPKKEIHAQVSFSGTQFVIKNTDSYDWTDVKMEINGGVFSGGYELKHPRISAGQTYTVGALQFANSDGERFNPFKLKPSKFSICGHTPEISCYVGGWD